MSDFTTTDLKERLAQITVDIINKYKAIFGEAHIATKEQMWRSGVEVLKVCPELENDKLAVGGRGVTTGLREVARIIERDRMTVKRWIDLVKIVGKTEEDFAVYAKEEKQRAIEGWQNGMRSSNALVSKFTGDQENYTPEYIIENARMVLGTIDLDPASCELAQKIVKAKTYFTEEDNGLEHPWIGNVFLNPPYQMPLIRQFTNKLIDELSNIKSAILLTNNSADTLWFHKCAINATAICFTKGRIYFYTVDREETRPVNGQAFFYLGRDRDKFYKVFSEIGLIMVRVL